MLPEFKCSDRSAHRDTRGNEQGWQQEYYVKKEESNTEEAEDDEDKEEVMYSVVAHGVRVAPAASSAGLRLGLRPLSLHLGLNINVDALVLTLCPTPV